jgi:hypothetical protein
MAFQPRSGLPGEDVVGSLVGVLLAGGPNGKTEVFHGWATSTVELRSEGEGVELAARLRAQILGWCDAAVEVVDREAWDWPERGDERWIIRRGRRYLDVLMPVTRDGGVPMDCIWAVR